MAKLFYASDADPSIVNGKTVAIVGYGNQGRAQALNLRDNGCTVVVGARKDGKGWRAAERDEFKPLTISDATIQADLVMMTLPDESMADIYREHIESHLTPTKTLMVCHGFTFHFKLIAPPPEVDVLLATPKASGASLRSAFVAGKPIVGLFAVQQDATDMARQLAMSYLWGIGCAGATMIETTFEEECVTDLFGEQAVLCGGIPELIKAAFETLVQAGYSPESAYLECLHEAKLITDLLYERGLTGMRQAISDTAEWGGYTAGQRIVNDGTKKEMKTILNEIQNGTFAQGWVQEAKSGKKSLASLRDQESKSTIETTGEEIRKLMKGG